MINFLRLPEVVKRTGLKKSSIYDMMNKGQFPKAVKLGIRAVGWVDSEVDDYVKERARKLNLNRESYSHAEVQALTGMPRSTIGYCVRKGLFPKPYHVSNRARWLKDDIDAWTNKRIADRAMTKPQDKALSSRYHQQVQT